MKDLIISAIANYTKDKIETYIESINNCGFTGDKMMVVYNVSDSTIEYLQTNGWQVIQGELVGYPHMKRLIDIYWVLRQLKNEYRYVITTDVRDVVFQINPSEYLEKNLKKRILVSSENVLYKDEPWGIKNILEGYNELLLERFEANETCNVGVLAGHQKDITDLLLLNYLVSQSGNTNHYTDQSSFNFIVHNELVSDSIQIEGIETNWALQMGTLPNEKLIGKYELNIKEGLLYNGEYPFVIVHQYDRNDKTKNLYK
jgi:hypothetical protein